MEKVAIYIRVSTSHQIDKDSLPLQREQLTSYSKFILNIDNYHIFEDAGFSAGNTKRPAYKEMMERIKKKEFTHLLIWKLDRISRNLRDFVNMYEELREYDVKLISKTEQFDTSSVMGNAMLKMALIFAEMERLLTRERVEAIMMARAEEGKWNGSLPPFGFKKDKNDIFPVIDPNEAKIVQYIFDLYEKHKSTIKVASQLNLEHIYTKRGNQWTEKAIRDVLRRDFYIGTYTYNKRKQGSKRRLKTKDEWIVIPDNHPALIDKDQFERVGKILDANFKGNFNIQRENTKRHIFQKKMYCGTCGRLLAAGQDTPRKDGYRPSRYTCSTNRNYANIYTCNSFISDIHAAPFVLNYIANIIRITHKSNNNSNTQRSVTDIKRMLLRGYSFIDIENINNEALKQIHLMSLNKVDKDIYVLNKKKQNTISDGELQKLETEHKKNLTALKRLEDLYLFGEDGISRKDYVLRKNEITDRIELIDQQIQKHLNTDLKKIDDTFLDQARQFLMSNALLKSRDIDYRKLLDTVGIEVIFDFIDSVIKKITIKDKRITSITFKNGVKHSFTYKKEEDRKYQLPERKKYLKHVDMLLEYMKTTGNVNRPQVEDMTGLSRDGATKILNELIQKDKVERIGNSVATQYRYKKSTRND